ncbi:MAG: IS110 family transposase [Caldilineaceae bacterium SB0661_bin_34]|nr:IS110 family transposase [Caldilineaceae bacterium SB0661_bin_34]
MALRSQATLYRSVPGVGSLTAAMLVAFLPELGQRDSKALTALVGFAPWSRDSGHKRGQRSSGAVGPPCVTRCTWRRCP